MGVFGLRTFLCYIVFKIMMNDILADNSLPHQEVLLVSHTLVTI